MGYPHPTKINPHPRKIPIPKNPGDKNPQKIPGDGDINPGDFANIPGIWEICTSGYGVLEKLKYQNIIWSLSLYFDLLPVSQALPVTGQILYFFKRAHQVIPYHLRKTVWQYLKSAARKVVMLVTILKKYLIN